MRRCRRALAQGPLAAGAVLRAHPSHLHARHPQRWYTRLARYCRAVIVAFRQALRACKRKATTGSKGSVSSSRPFQSVAAATGLSVSLQVLAESGLMPPEFDDGAAQPGDEEADRKTTA